MPYDNEIENPYIHLENGPPFKRRLRDLFHPTHLKLALRWLSYAALAVFYSFSSPGRSAVYLSMMEEIDQQMKKYEK